MNKKISIIIIGLCILLTACSSNTPASDKNTTTSINLGHELTSNVSGNYKIGRNPNVFIFNSENDTVYYKSFVLINNENRYQGLYSNKIDGKDKKLLYNDFEGFLNVYNGFLYFTNTKGQLIELNLSSKKSNIIAGDDKYHVYGPLIIEEILFYNNIDTEDNCDLIAYNIKEKKKIVVSNNTFWRFLSNFKNNICFIDKNTNLKTWNRVTKEITSYGVCDIEILQMIDDGSVIGYKNRSFVKKSNGKLTEFLKVEDTYNAIVIDNNLFISTVDKHSYTQIFKYSLETNKLEKIAAPDFPLIGYCGKYLFCSSDSGMGDLQIINTENGECKTFDSRFK